ncbi:DNA polymerase III subunit alpha [Candidatus Bandiella woodruffii]|uniref:DNA polymerase III subunit alpha n=2 Tax=Candidatus Bandiella euplotis TaxID=1664265 RepID=A0ABZ0UJL0_9RICK|nr:DNA polymerase III subunit alpha [Candidatus Bandiella woodruffii]
MSNYINLRTYSDYSIGKSVIKVQDLAEHCFKSHIPAVALTDFNNLFGSLEFSLECQKKGVQPIIGSVLTLNYGNEKEQYANILLIAKTREGYENLMKLVSNCYLGNTDHTTPPHVLLEDIFENSKGLIALCGSNNSPMEQLFYADKHEAAKDLVNLLLENFQDNLFLELTRTENHEHQYEFEKFLATVALEKSIPIVATNPAQYINQTMQDALDALICITEGRYLIEDDRNKAGSESYFKSKRQMEELFSDVPEAVRNTELIAKKCSFLLKESKPLLPKFLNSNQDEAEELKQQATKGLKLRLASTNFNEDTQKKYFDRLEFELAVINKMDFGGYFLIVADFIQWSKKNGIPVGPGRGSGVGSIVAWSLQISDMDPIKFGLLFERFLNPDRVSMPDFDIDFCQDRRDEVIEYVRKKFGSDKVAHIITFGKLQARAVLRDVGRVLQIPYMQVDSICKMVPNNPANPVSLKEAIDMDKELKAQSKSDPSLEKLISISLKLEGVNRHISTHAAGVVIADKELTKVIALYKDANSSMPVVQYSLKYAEKIGLVKFDFLGLKTLTVISWTCKLIKASGINLDFNKIALDDAKTYQMLANGDCIGVFQFESSGMRESIKKTEPDNIDDLVALGSLYRPGPMDNIPSYINRKHGREKIDYIHPLLEPVLKETYGIIVYQEQVMEIARVLAGYSLGEADLLRRAMGKKIKEEMEAQRNKFVQGCINNCIKNYEAEEIFNLVNKFASYGFNKSHAVAYAYISYQTAYLKANFPLEFLTASINLEIDNTDKIYIFLMEAKKFGITILLPDINYSKAEFTIKNGKLRFGLAGLKGVGKKIMDLITEEREKRGRFKDIFDFVERLAEVGINKKVLENLIKSGAFDDFNVGRLTLLMNIELLLKQSSVVNKNEDQLDLFFDSNSSVRFKPKLEEFNEWNEKERMQAEFESFGYYLTAHPLEKYQIILQKLGITEACEIDEIENQLSKIKLAGVLLSKKVRSTARGKYAFLQISDLKGIIDLSIFNEDLLYKTIDLLKEGNTLYFKAEVRKDAAGIRIIAEDVQEVRQAILDSDIRLNIVIKNKNQLDFLRDKINNDDGVKISLMAELESGDVVDFKHNSPLLIDIIELEKLIQNGIKVNI